MVPTFRHITMIDHFISQSDMAVTSHLLPFLESMLVNNRRNPIAKHGEDDGYF
jgi:hypothetical protein